jgi:hypothetical protein
VQSPPLPPDGRAEEKRRCRKGKSSHGEWFSPRHVLFASGREGSHKARNLNFDPE